MILTVFYIKNSLKCRYFCSNLLKNVFKCLDTLQNFLHMLQHLRHLKIQGFSLLTHFFWSKENQNCLLWSNLKLATFFKKQHFCPISFFCSQNCCFREKSSLFSILLSSASFCPIFLTLIRSKFQELLVVVKNKFFFQKIMV